MMEFKAWLVVGAVLAAAAVALGAFGAHALSAVLDANGRAGTFDTASRYHLIHAVAIFAIAALATSSGVVRPDALRLPLILLTAGTVVFCGALYLLAAFDLGVLGAVAPIGGLLLIAGWLALALAVANQPTALPLGS